MPCSYETGATIIKSVGSGASRLITARLLLVLALFYGCVTIYIVCVSAHVDLAVQYNQVGMSDYEIIDSVSIPKPPTKHHPCPPNSMRHTKISRDVSKIPSRGHTRSRPPQHQHWGKTLSNTTATRAPTVLTNEVSYVGADPQTHTSRSLRPAPAPNQIYCSDVRSDVLWFRCGIKPSNSDTSEASNRVGNSIFRDPTGIPSARRSKNSSLIC